jgi:cyclophilin family peptidyl-prolyl cis-trans isomerase
MFDCRLLCAAATASTVPKTAENFRQLCLGTHKHPNGRPLHYKGTQFHRIIKDFMSVGLTKTMPLRTRRNG